MLFLIGLLFGVCVSNTTATASPSQSDNVASAISLASKTVALVADDGEGGLGSYCSGVWISSSTILTALHCVSGKALVGYVVREDIFPQASRPAVVKIDARFAVTYAVDEAHDLALLHAVKPPTGHGVALTRIGTVEQGAFAQSMGHPRGMWFSYASGDVAAVRMIDIGDGEVLYVQTTTPTSPGVSGGGLFDREGSLIGICHASHSFAQLMNFYVHKAHVDAFVRAHGRAL